MTDEGKRRAGITAGELLDKLEADPEYKARMEALELEIQANRREFAEAERPLVKDLNRIGYGAVSVEQLRNSRSSYRSAVPVLLDWLTKMEHPRVREAIVRALSVPWAKPLAALPLIEEFKRTSSFSDPGYGWVVGNALSIVADDSVFEELASLTRDKKHGGSREMLAVALGNMKDPRAEDLLMELLDDEDIAGHALMGLRKLKAVKARSKIEPFLKHPRTWWRNEAKKALAAFDKATT